MPQYTVVGYYEDNSQIWVEQVETENATEAVREAARSIVEGNGWRDGDYSDLAIVAIFAGHHRDLNERELVSAAADWFEEEENDE